jgi:hypothetical protein
MHVQVGESLLQLWHGSGARSLVVVGTGKNVGKTVTLREIYNACMKTEATCAIASIGRDGESTDVVDAAPKPSLWLQAGTVLATARDLLPRSPASEVLAQAPYVTAAGQLLYARVHTGANYELVGPPSASALRAVVRELYSFVPRVLVDGAVDRVAALAGGEDAIVVAAGAAAASTQDEAIDDLRALVQRLNTPRVGDAVEALTIEGALTPGIAAQLIREGERRTIVVRDPTQIALTGKTALYAFERLTIRCLRPLRVIATTIASIGRERAFEPRTFAREVARATGLPTFDVFASERAA